ncbi:MAG TPA: methylmalonyl-CoA mutase family protein [Chthoniobacterales bacterium]|nr:methylmalonyl-CoA mutase family protein [Chthoniobacterales bacterium]
MRNEPEAAEEVLNRWREIRSKIGTALTPTGIKLPTLALPEIDEPGEITRFLLEEGVPGEFPYLSAAYPEQYLMSGGPNGSSPVGNGNRGEEPTRLFAGLGLPEDTNARLHYLSRNQQSKRLSTAFDGPTLYGVGAAARGVFGKIGEGGVAVDTVDDVERLYAGFALDQPRVSVSMTISGPAPILLAMYIAAAKRRFGPNVLPKLRGTIQADVLKEVQAQNELIFPIEPSMRFLADMVDFCATEMPRWYPISISGYHIGEAGATPVQQAAYTLSNGFAYVDDFQQRGMSIDVFGPRLSFFLDCGLDIEYVALARVCRKIWALGMRDVFGANSRAQRLKLHTQTSGRSLVAADWKNNLTRTAVELVLACMNATNSCHSNAADEPFTTPSEEYARYAAHAQAILLEESGLFRHMMNTLAGSPGMRIVADAVEKGILEEFEVIEEQGGVLGAVERRYQRSQIQAAAHLLESQISSGERSIIGLNRYTDDENRWPNLEMTRTPREKKQLHVDRVHEFHRQHADQSEKSLDNLTKVVESGGNVFTELINTVEHCSLGQITSRLTEAVGKFRPMV